MQQTSGKTMAKNTLFLSIRMAFVLVVSLYTSRVFLNVLGVVDYGINNVVAGFVSMFSFMNTALANGIQRFYNYEMGANGESSLTKVYNTSLIIQVIIAGVILLLLESVGLYYLYHKMVIPEERFTAAFWLFQISTFSSLIVVMQIPYSAAILAYEKMDWFALVSIIDVLLKLGFALLIPYIPFDKLIVFGLFSLLISCITFLMYYIYAKAKFKPLVIKKGFDKHLFTEMLSFSGWNLFGTLAGVGRFQGLNMILNLFFGPVVNAARGIAFQVSNAIQGFVGSLGVAVKPQMISSYASGNVDRAINLMFSISKIRFYILFVLALPISLDIDYVLHLWLGDVVPEHTSGFVILALGMFLISNFNAPVSDVVHATGRMKKYQMATSIVSLCVLPASYIALKMGCNPESVFILDIVFVALNQLVALIVLKGLVSFSLRRYFIDCIAPILLTILMSIPIPYLIHLLLPENFFSLCIIILLSFLIVTSFFYFITLNKTERTLVKSMLLSSVYKIRLKKQ